MHPYQGMTRYRLGGKWGRFMTWLLSLAVLAAMTLVMLCAWAYGVRTKNGGWTDVFWALGSGIVLAVAAVYPLHADTMPQARQWLVAALVAVWGLRLGSYLARRVAGH